MSIITENLCYTYDAGTPRALTALCDVSIDIADGEIVGIIGPTGSGKTTLIQHFNGLLRPTSGRVLVDGVSVGDLRDMREIRRRVGLLFQYPEYQLFEETVYDDLAFGPRNLGCDEEEVKQRVYGAMARVGLPPELARRSPFALSGGQMRRVAIAGVLAMNPRVLILDEPTAGLDPAGRREILNQVAELNRQLGLTVVMVSHQMEEIARLAHRLVVMKQGRVLVAGAVRDVFTQPALLAGAGLRVPPMTELMLKLRTRGWDVRTDVFTIEEARKEILSFLRPGTRPGRTGGEAGGKPVTGAGAGPDTGRDRGAGARGSMAGAREEAAACGAMRGGLHA